MRRTRILLAVASAAFAGLLALPAETAAVPAVPARVDTVAVVVDGPRDGCDLPMPTPFTRFMDRFTRTGNCYQRYWTLTGWVDAGDDARGLLKAWRSWLRTSKYHTDGGISCRWNGSTRICSQTIVMNSGLAYGGLTTKVGPVRDDGTRAASVKVRMGYGG